VPTSRPVRAAASRWRRRVELVRRWLGEADRGRLLGLTALALAAAGLMVWRSGTVTAAALFIPLLLSDMLLHPRRVPRFVVFLVVVLAVGTWLEYYVFGPGEVPARRWATILTTLAGAALVLFAASRRMRLGVGGLTGGALLADLQARITRQGVLPYPPPGWHAEVATRSAGGTSFAGDFVVAHATEDESRLEIAVVDVSGKGVHAGTRSLVLSGALSALLASIPAEEFLTEANRFVLRQGWGEGFATAVHLSVDLNTGEFALRSAGHPPAVQYLAGAGRWLVHERAEGPMLGITPDPTFTTVRGHLGYDDAFLLYTDGLVERTRRDIGLGIDRLIGQAERLLSAGFRGAAQVLVDRVGDDRDDCAVVVVERSWAR
jgi:hypothetical protein